MKKYAMYLRKSRADGDLSLEEALSTHEKMLTDLAHSMNLNIVKIYREVVSGESIESRPEMTNLLNDIYANEYDGVLVKEIERLSRGNAIEQGIIAEAFKITNTQIITPNKVYDPELDIDEEYLEFGLFMSRREYKVINRRMRDGIRTNSEKGKYLGSITPYGYEKCIVGKNKTLSIIEEEAEIVRMMYEFHIEGLSYGKIADELDSMGVKTRKGRKWSRATICDIIKNPIYKGYITWSKKKTVKAMQDGKIIKKRIKDNDFILEKGLHEPLVTEEVWQMAQ